MERMDTRIEEEKSTTCAQLRIGYLEENLLFQTIQPKIDRTEASIFSSILNFGDALFNLETEWIANSFNFKNRILISYVGQRRVLGVCIVFQPWFNILYIVLMLKLRLWVVQTFYWWLGWVNSNSIKHLESIHTVHLVSIKPPMCSHFLSVAGKPCGVSSVWHSPSSQKYIQV